MKQDQETKEGNKNISSRTGGKAMAGQYLVYIDDQLKGRRGGSRIQSDEWPMGRSCLEACQASVVTR
jgi:hypothetical protein